jgi:hypothetical protein
MKAFQVNALNLARAFSEQTRDDSSHFFMLPDSAPAWMHDAVRTAHDDEFPNDWRFSMARSIAYAIAECESIDDARDDAMEIGDRLADIYTGQLLNWYAAMPSRLDYCDQYREDFGADAADTTLSHLMAAQAYAIEKMIHTILNACEARAVEIELFPV